jgi:hypothetical protein
MRMTRRGRERGTDYAEHDCRHGGVLIASRVLAEHALGKEEQHQQAGSQRWLHDDQRRQQQGHHLQRPAQDRESRAQQPPGAPDQAYDKGRPQVLVVGRLSCIQRLQGDP